MKTFWQSALCLLALSSWRGILAQVTPLPEEKMNVVSCFSILAFFNMAALN